MRNVNSTLLYQWFDEVWNKSDATAIDRLMTGESKAQGIIPDDQPGGPEGFKVFYNDFRDRFSDVNVKVEDVVSEDDMESARTTVTAVHKESGKKVTFTGMCMVKVEDGKIASAWNNFDFLSMFEQLGQKLSAPQESVGTP